MTSEQDYHHQPSHRDGDTKKFVFLELTFIRCRGQVAAVMEGGIFDDNLNTSSDNLNEFFQNHKLPITDIYSGRLECRVTPPDGPVMLFPQFIASQSSVIATAKKKDRNIKTSAGSAAIALALPQQDAKTTPPVGASISADVERQLDGLGIPRKVIEEFTALSEHLTQHETIAVRRITIEQAQKFGIKGAERTFFATTPDGRIVDVLFDVSMNPNIIENFARSAHAKFSQANA